MFAAEGKTLGRPRTDPDVEAKVRELAAGGMGKGRIARTLGIGVSVTRRILAGKRWSCTGRALGANGGCRATGTSGSGHVRTDS
jgi:hypothetical protein